MKTYRPIQDRIIVEVKIQDKTKGGIHLIGKSKVKESVAKVLAVGPGLPGPDGELIPGLIKVGDLVLFPPHTGNKIQDGNWILRESEVSAVVEV